MDVVLHHPRNRGKGAAIRAGIAARHRRRDRGAGRRPRVRPRRVAATARPDRASGKADAVFGSRFLGGEHRVLYFWHSVGNQAPDPPVEHVHRPEPDRHGDLLQDGAGAADEIAGAHQRPVRLRARAHRAAGAGAGADLGGRRSPTPAGPTPKGKKIGWRDGVAAFWHILRFNLVVPDGQPTDAAKVLAEAAPMRSVAPAPAQVQQR